MFKERPRKYTSSSVFLRSEEYVVMFNVQTNWWYMKYPRIVKVLVKLKVLVERDLKILYSKLHPRCTISKIKYYDKIWNKRPYVEILTKKY